MKHLMNGNLADHGISLRTYRMGTQRTLCPNCSDHRRNKTDRCLSVTIDTEGAKFLCHHCGFKGAVKHEENNIIQHRKTEVEAKPMAVVKPMQTTDLTEQSVAFLSGRGISPETARALNVKSVTWWTNGAQKETDCLAFPYSYQGRIYAAKFRSTEVKAFASNGAPQTFFNEEGVEDWSEIIITEGEMDVLALHEAGFRNAVSIPLGAVNKATNGTPDPREDGKFSFLWRAEEKLKGCKKIIIACDADGPGKVTAEEIARRVGKDRCWSVDWPEGAKDANDVLRAGGVAGLRNAVSAAKPWPVAGLYEAGHFFDKVRDIYSNGLHAGESTGYPCLDDLYTVVPGHMTVVTGVPGSGKSELIDQMMVNLAKSKGWTFAVCSFENPPELHIAKLAQKFMGKPFFSGLYPKMTDAELAIALDFVHMHFSFVHQTDGSLSTIDSILERLKVAVLRHGVRGAVIDPYNYIQKSRESSETDWISEMLSRVKAFAMAHGIHVWFVAHPTKLPVAADGTMPIPNGMTISGSAAWFAKADMGLTVHRPDRQHSNAAEVHVWKVRFNWTGKEGVAELMYRNGIATYVDPRHPPAGVTPF